jgi:S1-C subfamily serine protease
MNATATVRQPRRKFYGVRWGLFRASSVRAARHVAKCLLLTAILVTGLTSGLTSGLGCSSATGSIGAHLGKRSDGRLFVRYVPSDMTGAKAGLVSGDEVTAIDGRDVRQMSPEDIRNALRGKVGTTVTLTVKREGLSRDLKVERGPFAKGD